MRDLAPRDAVLTVRGVGVDQGHASSGSSRTAAPHPSAPHAPPRSPGGCRLRRSSHAGVGFVSVLCNTTHLQQPPHPTQQSLNVAISMAHFSGFSGFCGPKSSLVPAQCMTLATSTQSTTMHPITSDTASLTRTHSAPSFSYESAAAGCCLSPGSNPLCTRPYCVRMRGQSGGGSSGGGGADGGGVK